MALANWWQKKQNWIVNDLGVNSFWFLQIDVNNWTLQKNKRKQKKSIGIETNKLTMFIEEITTAKAVISSHSIHSLSSLFFFSSIFQDHLLIVITFVFFFSAIQKMPFCGMWRWHFIFNSTYRNYHKIKYACQNAIEPLFICR